MYVVTAAQMQAMDRKTIENFGVPGQVLMENAGRGATRSFLEKLFKKDGPVGILAGHGNNGGDGFVIARYLAQREIEVHVFLLAKVDKVKGDAASNLHLLTALSVPVTQLPDPDAFRRHIDSMRRMHYWIDAILGTGLTAEVKDYFKKSITFINTSQKPIFAVDIPSGLNADTGQPCGIAVKATATATFAYPKIGHLLHPGVQYCGDIDIIDIGIPPQIAEQINPTQSIITPQNVRRSLGSRQPDTHKGRTGHVLVVGGAPGKTGAAAMAALSALRAGAGLVTLAAGAGVNAVLASQLTEVMTLPLPDDGAGFLTATAFDIIKSASADKKCIALGPGMGTTAGAKQLVQRLVREIDLPLVIDADGLNNLAGDLKLLHNRDQPAVLTPHPGEMARLTGLTVTQIQADRVGAARCLAHRHRLFVVLKGARTIIASPTGHAWINPSGNAGMATAGMGDVLTGLIAGIMAQGRPTIEAVLSAVYLHGLAADMLARKAPWGYTATDVIKAAPQALKKVLNNPPALPFRGPVL